MLCFLIFYMVGVVCVLLLYFIIIKIVLLITTVCVCERRMKEEKKNENLVQAVFKSLKNLNSRRNFARFWRSRSKLLKICNKKWPVLISFITMNDENDYLYS